VSRLGAPQALRENIYERVQKLRLSVDLEQIRLAGVDLNPLEYDFVYGYPPLSALPSVDGPMLVKQSRPASQVALYVHLPFCSYACSFCYFAKYIHPGDTYVHEYLDTLASEIRAVADWAGGSEITSVYFGGGTPTYLPSDDLICLIDLVQASFRIASDYEWTVEASPETIDRPKVRNIVASGVNRISLGVQSFDSQILSAATRLHTPEQALQAIEAVLSSGVPHHNIDLIYGFPGQQAEDLWHEFDVIARLDLRSVTWYQLWQHMNTPLRKQELYKRQVTIEGIVRLKCMIAGAMTALGFQRDKVDWFLKDTSEGQRQQEHKWACGDLLGLGVSAYGFVNGIYYRNHPTFQNYTAAVETSDFGLAYAMRLTPDQLVRRQLVLGIKRAQGVALNVLEFAPPDSQRQFRSRMSALEDAGLVTVTDGFLRLTPVGELFGDDVANALALADDHRTCYSEWHSYASE